MAATIQEITRSRRDRAAQPIYAGTQCPSRPHSVELRLDNNDYPEGDSAMSNSLQLAHQWWDALNQVDRQRVWDSRHSYLAGDLVESMANAGVPVVSDGRWSCVSVGPTGFTVPTAVQQLLDGLSRLPNGDRPLGST